jgi:hypothetical protein
MNLRDWARRKCLTDGDSFLALASIDELEQLLGKEVGFWFAFIRGPRGSYVTGNIPIFR